MPSKNSLNLSDSDTFQSVSAKNSSLATINSAAGSVDEAKVEKDDDENTVVREGVKDMVKKMEEVVIVSYFFVVKGEENHHVFVPALKISLFSIYQEFRKM